MGSDEPIFLLTRGCTWPHKGTHQIAQRLMQTKMTTTQTLLSKPSHGSIPPFGGKVSHSAFADVSESPVASGRRNAAMKKEKETKRRRGGAAAGAPDSGDDKQNPSGAALRASGDESKGGAGASGLLPLPPLPLGLPVPRYHFEELDARNAWTELYRLTDEELEGRLLEHQAMVRWLAKSECFTAMEWVEAARGEARVEARLLKVIAVRWIELRKKGVRA